MPKNKKWFEVLFGLNDILKLLYSREAIIKAEDVFEIGRGNFYWTFTKLAGLGANEFFYLTDEKVKKRGIPTNYLFPLLVSSRYTKYFMFTKKDWIGIKKEKWVLLCRKPKNKLPQAVLKYIKWGKASVKPERVRSVVKQQHVYNVKVRRNILKSIRS